MDLDLTGKIGIVTGASGGIGRAISEQLAREGVHLILCARQRERLEAVAKLIKRQTKTKVLTVSTDLSSLDGIKFLLREGLRMFQRIDILINNAGAIKPGSIFTIGDREWHEVWELKVFGYIRLIREVFPIMKKLGGGRIVNIIGLAGEQPNASYIAGSGANAALMNMTKALADEGGPHNILVNGINPGPIKTDRFREMMIRIGQEKKVPPVVVEKQWMKDNPLGRAGNPGEVAAAVAFLVSDRASYINGAIIPVDGGGRRSI